MPLTETISHPELRRSSVLFEQGIDPGRDHFFSTLFRALDQCGVRYAALHAKQGLLFGTDFIVHPHDESKLSTVFSELRKIGYHAVQCLELESGEQRVVFACVGDENPTIVSITLEFAGRDGLRSETLLEQRTREGILWTTASKTAPGGGKSNSRVAQRFVKPRNGNQGAFLVFLGPDGVGKTTLLRQLSASLIAIFPEQRIYRWRPGVFSNAQRPVCLPHSKPMRSIWSSIAYLFFTCLDFTAGYWMTIRSMLARNDLVIFDRYYQDMLIDPKRYRYTGPMWLVRAIDKIVPPRDIFFVVLDAEEQTILTRKQQLPIEEIRRQRAAYRHFAGSVPASVLVDTEQTVELCSAQALKAVVAHLSQRLSRRNPMWFATARWADAPQAANAFEQTLNSVPRQP